ncbi:MAG TPA: CHAD domain-containing protein [Microbacterium sp.]|nr:CHAD domain-containing protein [Microbacterium sp.]
MDAQRDRTETLGELVQRFAAEQCDVIIEQWDALERRDADSVHPVRVAIRRLRATLRTFRRVYDREAGEAFAQELRWWGMLLGGVRDLQVLAERFSTAEDPREPRGRAEVYLATQLERELESAWRAVSEALTTERATALKEAVVRWREDPPFSERAGRPARRAGKRVKKAGRRVGKRLARVRAAVAANDPAAAELLHSARKAAKRHRYALELAAPVLGPRTEEEIERRRDLQDALGAHQDAVVAAEFLVRLDLGGESPEVAFALGELTEATRRQADDVRSPLDAAQE